MLVLCFKWLIVVPWLFMCVAWAHNSGGYRHPEHDTWHDSDTWHGLATWLQALCMHYTTSTLHASDGIVPICCMR